MQKIDVEQIMQKIKGNVEKRSRATDYEKDIQMIEQLSQKTIEDESLVEMIHQLNNARKLTVPSSIRSGYTSNITNKFLLKFYYVVKKILDGFLTIQSKIDTTLIHEVSALKKKMGLESLNHFPFEEFDRKFAQDEDTMQKTLSVISKHLEKKERILDIGFKNKKLLEYASKKQASRLEAVTGENLQLDEYRHSGIKVSKISYLEYLNRCEDESFDLVTLVDSIDTLDLDLLIAILQHSKRILKKGGSLIIQALNPESTQYNSLAIDPRIKKPMHYKLIEFVLNHLKFSKVEKLDTDIYKNQEKYVLCASK
jgi:ubiquinone/menaquinone biosynthesis C-methylase UbiE